ncbi:MAG: hypothetical protein E6J79_16165 [Deltaproteobacteria bacterium]|nr:MAG: hypothetical protein E6J79_16165 [Deltaproteobacteria bacterium]
MFANRAATLLALPPEPFETMVDRPLVRLMRPLMARRLRARPRQPEPLPRPNDGPGAAAVATLDGSPAAGVLRAALDAAWASEVLPRRTKTLALAVVARALGCARSEGESVLALERVARALGCARSEGESVLALERDGFGARDVEEILATLGSTRLDARETRIVPFARETVRYHRPVPIQRRMREVAEGLEPAEVLEAVGVVALANTVCRLGLLVDLS